MTIATVALLVYLVAFIGGNGTILFFNHDYHKMMRELGRPTNFCPFGLVGWLITLCPILNVLWAYLIARYYVEFLEVVVQASKERE